MESMTNACMESMESMESEKLLQAIDSKSRDEDFSVALIPFAGK
jgi:hypothetical protein